jgi:acetylornithine deacetylase/succinyl-diaminopimelate desuccinylase-like protein
MAKKAQILSVLILTVASVGIVWSFDHDSLFTAETAKSPLALSVFAFLESNEDRVIDEWIRLTEIPSPSGHEAKRAAYLLGQFQSVGLEEVHIDAFGNVIGLWKGEPLGKNIIVTAHMDTVFQDVWEIKVKREGNVLKAPGIGDDTASLINLLWSVRALKHVGFQPKNTYYFLATTGEEVGFVGMDNFLNTTEESFDLVLALDGDLGKVHYGALGFGGGRITFRGPGAHTMQSRGVPNPNLAVARAIDRLTNIHLPAEPLEKWTILNIGLIGGGKVRNAVSQESFFSVDLRSANQVELEKVQGEIKHICQDVATELGVEVEIDLNENSKAYQISGARESFLVKTVLDILVYLKVADVEVDPLGSTEANVGIEKGILSVNLGRTYGRYKHSLREEADIDGLFLAMKQILLLLICLD